MKEVIYIRLAREQLKLDDETADAVKKKEDDHLAKYRKLLQQRLQMGFKTYRRIKTDAQEKESAKDSTTRPCLSIVLKGKHIMLLVCRLYVLSCCSAVWGWLLVIVT